MIRIIEFSGENCGPCHMQEQILNDVSKDKNLKIPFVFTKINVDNNKELKDLYQIIKVPTLIFLRDYDIVYKQEGLMMKTNLINKIKSLDIIHE